MLRTFSFNSLFVSRPGYHMFSYDSVILSQDEEVFEEGQRRGREGVGVDRELKRCTGKWVTIHSTY